MKGRDSYRLATCIQEQKHTVLRKLLSVLKSGTVFADGLKCHFSISFSEEMVRLFDFIFVSRSFLGVRHQKLLKKSDITILD